MILTFLSPSRQVLCSVWVDSDTYTFNLRLDRHRDKRHYACPPAFGELIFLRIDHQHYKSVQQAAKGLLSTPANRLIQTGIG
jgi:hypothetical protein